MNRARKHFLPAVTVAVFVLFSGCDTIAPPEEGVVTEHEQEFRFETTADQLAGGANITAQSGLDVSATVANLGFSRGDIIDAEVVSAELSRVTPLSMSLNEILTSGAVRFSAGGNTATVAQANSIGSGSSTSMQPGGGNIGSFARASSTAAVLNAAPVDGLPSGNYVFRVRMRIRLTLEGI